MASHHRANPIIRPPELESRQSSIYRCERSRGIIRPPELESRQSTAPSRTPDALCTLDLGASVTDIGRLSTDHIDAIIGVPTGPMWPTFNIWNADTIKLRLLLLAYERVELLPEHTVHANHLSLVPEILTAHGLL